MLRDIKEIFPIIDDPVNIAYSKIKQWMMLQTNIKIHCKATSRVDRTVEFSFMGMSRIYKCKFKTTLFSESDIDKYLYVGCAFKVPDKMTTERSTSGEDIPVDISYIGIDNVDLYPIILQDYSGKVLFEDSSLLTSLHVEAYFFVGKIVRNKYNQIDVENVEKAYKRIQFEDSYRPSVGRLWVLRKHTTETSYCDLDTLCSWELYNIDSDNNYTLMDLSNTRPNELGFTHMWPAQYGPSIDHPTSFVYRNGTGNAPKGLHVKNTDYWVEIRETEFSLDKHLRTFAKLTEKAEPYLNTRGHIPSLFPYLFQGLEIGYVNGAVSTLLYSYICNMNIRYLLCPINYETGYVGVPLNNVLSRVMTDGDGGQWTTNNNAHLILDKYPDGVLPNGTPSGYKYKDFFIGNVITAKEYAEDGKYKLGGTLTLADSSNKNTLVRYVAKAFSTYIPGSTNTIKTIDGIYQNSLPSPNLPHVKWYIRQFVYVLSFMKYSNHNWSDSFPDAVFPKSTANSYFRHTPMNSLGR